MSNKTANPFAAITARSQTVVLRDYKVVLNSGLSTPEATRRAKKNGPNEIASQAASVWKIFFSQFRSSFIYLLLGAAALAVFLGEYLDGCVILAFVLINGLLGFYQQYHSEKILHLLKNYVVQRARVRRDSRETVIPGRELVAGDVLVVETGDVIPADIRILEENDLLVDESVLTGESVPVKKIAQALPRPTAEIYKAVNLGFSGTTVVGGKGVGIVIGIGEQAVIGSIARLAVETVRTTSFEKDMNRFSRFILKMVAITLVFLFLANTFIKGSGTGVAELLIFSIALAVSVIPEALPLVTTFSLSRGALRLAEHKVVVKRLSSIEDLGSLEVLCTDKTGTLTENELKVAKTLGHNAEEPLFLASLAAPFLHEKTRQANNAFDVALRKKLAPAQFRQLSRFVHTDELPFNPKLRTNSVVVEQNRHFRLIVRGAPEEIIRLCKDIPAHTKREYEGWVKEAGLVGLRVIAVASKSVEGNISIERISRAGLELAGFVAFIDPLKKTAADAVAKAKRLGVAVKILTGDSREVAGSVAQQVGLVERSSQVITGQELDRLSYRQQHKAVEEYSVFARVSPEQKYHIIQLLKERHGVGFLGEGINDAPALKIANVALAVSGASDVAQEASDIVLLKKSLNVIIDGIHEGREVFANTMKYIRATLSSNFGNFYAIAVASLIIDFLPMLPLQILLLNLLSDFPMISVSTDSVDLQEIKKPHSYNMRDLALFAIFLGIVSTVFDFIFFAIFYRMAPEVLQTNWFIGSILTELVFLFSVRTRLFFLNAKRPSWTVNILTGLAAFITLVVPYTHFGQTTFNFTPPTYPHLVLILFIVGCYFAVSEGAKLSYYRWTNHQHAQA